VTVAARHSRCREVNFMARHGHWTDGGD